MLNAIRLIQEFTASLSYDEYLQSAMVQSAVERQPGVLGEAARRLSDEFRQAHPEINWRQIIGLRNILSHRYDEIEQEDIWTTITSKPEPLRTQLQMLASSLPDHENL
ncbi:MAG: HepT-like ribonuclease domain-containing protein [Cyanobacteria bacterium P01_A01_bin.135]